MLIFYTLVKCLLFFFRTYQNHTADKRRHGKPELNVSGFFSAFIIGTELYSENFHRI